MNIYGSENCIIADMGAKSEHQYTDITVKKSSLIFSGRNTRILIWQSLGIFEHRYIMKVVL